jgi:2-amino-4-hydroxy-6-hydroxymethyldihydropteridine diphosphokinase
MIVSSVSSVYETEPVGEVLDQPDFLNAVVRIVTWAGPEELLAICKGIERELGRDPDGARHAPRPIDIDILLLGDLEMETEALTVPHPEVRNRRFVLEPLVELEPDLAMPDGTEVADFLAALPEGEQGVRKLGPLIEGYDRGR